MSAWQPVAGWGGLYEVSRDGRVRKVGGEEIGMWANDQGYMLVRLSGCGQRRMYRVHRLVAEAFCQKQDGADVVNHIDHDRANNHADNLEWCTQQHNLSHARSAGRMVDHWRGRRGPRAVLSDAEVQAIRSRRVDGVSHMGLAKEFKVSKRTIGRILSMENYAYVA